MQPDLPLSIQYVWLIPLYGFSGMLLSLPWAAGWFKRQGPRPAAYLNLIMTLIGVIHGSLVLQQILQIGAQHLQFGWFGVGDMNLQIGFELSLTNLAALEFVTVLSSNLFFSYFLLEMLTLSTYLLVGFWYAQPLVVTAARDAFLTKRVGDVLLLMGMVALSAWAGSLEFNDLYEWSATATASGALSPLAGSLIGLGLIAGPMGKCAQFPMHLWLDEAMEGPNPASILRNSAVVTCGALVLLKVMPLLRFSPLAVNVLLVVGTISAIGGALVAIAQVDLKRAFSYGTSSYLGLVFIAIALQQPAVALLLLFAHGLAKALIFMGVGSVICTTNCQDLTELGGLGARMPATTSAFLVAGAGLTGLFPLGCFWCFGLLVQALLPSHPFLAAVVLATNLLTAFNLVRVYRQVFLDTPHPKTRRAPEVGWLMALPMVSLSVMVLLLPLVFQRLNPVPGLAAINTSSVVLVVASGALGVVAGSLVRLDRFWSRSVLKPLRAVQDLLAYDFYTDKLYRATIVRLVAGFADLTNRFDQEVVTGLANRLGGLSMQGAEGLKLAVSGQMQTYVLTAVLGIVLLLASLVWSMG